MAHIIPGPLILITQAVLENRIFEKCRRQTATDAGSDKLMLWCSTL